MSVRSMHVKRGFLLSCLALVACQASDPVARGGGLIDGASIEEHMRFLASDELGGRATASQGYLQAAEYVAAAFERIGLEPRGEEESYYQQVPLVAAHLVPDDSRLTLHRDGAPTELEIEDDYVLQPDFVRQGAEIEAPLAYVGFGVRAPELGHDDYASIDAEGKILVVLHGAPASFPHNERAFFSSSRSKLENASLAGAVGVLFVELPEEREGSPWERTVTHSRMPGMRWLGPGGTPHAAHDKLFVVATLSAGGERKLFDDEAYGLERLFAAARDGESLCFDLSSRLSVLTNTRHERLRSPNVIGRLPGSDPALVDEHVVITAHLDHVGSVPVTAGEDGIHNGAYDNASGVAMLIEAAAAIARQERRPRRSVLFIAFTGEEKGLLGSQYFSEYPTVDPEKIVAAINLDMVLMFHPLRDVVAFGAEHSTLLQNVERAAAGAGLRVAEDPIPEEVFFVRSDQYSFVRKGIPAIFLVSGFDAGKEDGLEQFHDWMRDVYHSPADDMNQTFDFEAGAAFAELNLRIATDVANAEERPRWNAGDFFGTRFAADD